MKLMIQKLAKQKLLSVLSRVHSVYVMKPIICVSLKLLETSMYYRRSVLPVLHCCIIRYLSKINVLNVYCYCSWCIISQFLLYGSKCIVSCKCDRLMCCVFNYYYTINRPNWKYEFRRNMPFKFTFQHY